MIYVLNSKGKPLMPTVRHGRVRHLLRDKKAFIVNYHPFTVQLTKERSNEIQEVALGIDTGYENVGLSATTKDKVLFECKAELRTDLVEIYQPEGKRDEPDVQGNYDIEKQDFRIGNVRENGCLRQ